jgi:hypothetical protein
LGLENLHIPAFSVEKYPLLGTASYIYSQKRAFRPQDTPLDRSDRILAGKFRGAVENL